MLEVLLDLTTTTHGQGRAAGAIRVESELAAAMLQAPRGAVTPISWSAAERFVELDVTAARRYVTGAHVATPELTGNALERQARPAGNRRILLVTGSGWLSNPAFLHGLLQARDTLSAELHVVVHDLVHLLFPQWVAREEAARFGSTLEAMLTGADRVLVYSDSTARDIARVAARRGMTVRDIGRITLGTSLISSGYGVPRLSPGLPSIADRPFALYVSTIAKRKNHELLGQVWSRLAEELGERLPRLVLAGRVAPGQEPILDQLRRDPTLADHVIHLPSASDDDLQWLYRHCLFTVFPSLYEGWGLPVAESLALGTVCLASNASSIPEVAGGVTPLLDPLDVEGWTGAVRRCVLEPAALEAARARVSKYTPVRWEEAAARVWAAIEAPIVRIETAMVVPELKFGPTTGATFGPTFEPAFAPAASEPWRPIRDTFGGIAGRRARYALRLGALPEHGIRVALTLGTNADSDLHVETEINGLVVDGCVLSPGSVNVARTLDVPRDVLLQRGLLDVVFVARCLAGAGTPDPPLTIHGVSARALTREEAAAAVDARRDAWRLGETMAFTAGSPHLSLLGEGWGEPAHWGVWTVAPAATLSFRPLPQPGEPLILRALVRAFVPAAQPELSVEVLAGGTPLATWTFRHPADFTFVERAVTIPLESLADGIVHVQFSMPAVRSPKDLRMSGDERQLGIALSRAHCTTIGLASEAGWKGRRP